MNYFLNGLKEGFNFKGRCRRRDFFMFNLVSIIIACIIGMLDGLLGGGELLSSLYILVVIIPTIAIQTRRLHDIGKSGWMVLINLIPLIGYISLLFLLTRDSEENENKYGFNPKKPYLETVDIL